MVGLSQRHFFIGMIIGSMICLKWTKFIERKKAMFISGGAFAIRYFYIMLCGEYHTIYGVTLFFTDWLMWAIKKHSTANHHSNKCLKGEITNGVYIVECHCDRGIRPFIFHDGHVVRMVWDTSCFFPFS